MRAEVKSLEAAKAALMEAGAKCSELDDVWSLTRRITEANRNYNRARDEYIDAMWHHLPGVTVDLPSKPHNVAVIIEERPL